MTVARHASKATEHRVTRQGTGGSGVLSGAFPALSQSEL